MAATTALTPRLLTTEIDVPLQNLPTVASISEKGFLASTQGKVILISIISVSIVILTGFAMSIAALALNTSSTNRASSNSNSGSSSSSGSSTTYTYSQQFYYNTTSTAQCAAWNSFVSQLDPTRSYNSITLSGTGSTTIYHLNVAIHVTAIVQALHYGTTGIHFLAASVYWGTNYCSSGIDISQSPLCICPFSSVITTRTVLYPCAPQGQWGGINTTSCYERSQTITLTIQ